MCNFCPGCIIEGPPTQLTPAGAFMSSKPKNAQIREKFPAEKCIDGRNENLQWGDPKFSLCHTGSEKAPWLAIDYGANVAVQEVVLYNRADCCASYFMNAEIWLADEIPMSGAEKFKGKELLGTFAGPGASGERIVIQSQPGWEKKSGRYLIVQISNPGETILHLREVSATGSAIKCPSAGNDKCKTITMINGSSIECWDGQEEVDACQSCESYNLSTEWSAWILDKCEQLGLANGTSIQCGEGGTKTRRRRNHLNLEEVEEVACPSCAEVQATGISHANVSPGKLNIVCH